MSILIPRSVWKPQYANGFRVIGTSEWEAAGKETWLHHSVTTPPGPDATLEQDCAHMRFIESIGQTNYGGGISYTVVVMPSGRAFQGHDMDRQGSHTYQRNNRARAICLAGNYDAVVPNMQMLGTVALVLREWGCELDGGHRDVYATACPGQYAYARIGSINEAARSGVPIGDQPNPTIKEEDIMYLKVIEGTDKGSALMLSGGLVSGLGAQDAKWADETSAKANGALTVGVTTSLARDLINKSREQEAIAPLLRAVDSKLGKLIELLTPKPTA